MDDTWQRHKTFIVQCILCGVLFLLALLVKSNMYGDEIPERQRNATSMKSKLETSDSPSKKSIASQNAKAEAAREDTRSMAAQIGSLASGDAYARESIRWVLQNLGLESEEDAFFQMYKSTPQACLTRLREEARSVLLGKAARLGKEVDESFGILSGFEDAEVKTGIHGLAIVTDLVNRALEREGIDTIERLGISPRPRRAAGSGRQDGARAKVFSVRFGVIGEPDAVNDLFRSFNGTGNAVNRITVLDRVEYITRIREEEDTVKASFDLFGVQYRGLEEGEEN